MKKQVPYEILLQFSVTVANEIIATPSITGEYHSHHLNMMISYWYYIWLYTCQCNSSVI